MKQHERRMPRTRAERFAALSRVGIAFTKEVDEAAVLRLLAQTARDLTGAAFAALILRPLNEEYEAGEPLVPLDGARFHLAVVVGTTQEQEMFLRRVLLNGEELFAPFFQRGVPVHVPDVAPLFSPTEDPPTADGQDAADQAVVASAQGKRSQEEGRSKGLPPDHPVVRSFLGAPLFDQSGQVRGGLLLGHPKPGHFRQGDEMLMVSLTAQAALALEKARSARLAELREQQLSAVLDSVADGVTLIDPHGSIVRENGTARRLRERLQDTSEGVQVLAALLHGPAQRALHGEVVENLPLPLPAGSNKTQVYVVTALPLHQDPMTLDLLAEEPELMNTSALVPGAVVTWHEVQDASRLEVEREIIARLGEGGGKVMTVSAITHDATHPGETEQEIQRQASYIRLQAELIEQAHDAILVRDPDNRLLSWNQGAENLYGWSTQEALGQIPHLLLRTRFPQSRDVLEQTLEQTGHWEGELLHTCRDGSQVQVESRWVLVRDRQGFPSAILEINRDITERRALQQRLEETEHKARERASQLEAIFEAMTDAVLLYDRNGNMVQVNAAARTLFAFDAVPDYTSRPLEERPAPYVLQDLEGQVLSRQQWPLMHLLHGEMPAGEKMMEVMVRTLDGREVQVNVASAPVRDQDGRFLGTVLAIRDLSERYRLEQRLRETEREARERASQLEAIFEAVPEALLVYNREGYITRMNAAGHQLYERLRLSDYTAASLADWAVHVAMWNEHGQPLAREFFPTARLLAGEVLSPAQAVEAAMHDRQGETISLSITGGPLRDGQGQFTGVALVARDITERKRVEQALQQQTQQLHLQAKLIEQAHDAILVRDPDNRLLSWNRGAQQIYGWSVQEARGRVIHTLLRTRFPVSQVDVDTHLEHKGQWEGELRHTRRDGTEVLVDSRQVLVRDTEGQPSAILEINRDITARHQLEALQQQLQRETEAHLALLQLVLDELPSSVYLVYGRDARLILANRATATIWGVNWARHQPMSEFLSQNGIRVLDTEGKELTPEQHATWRVLHQGKAVYQYQEIIRRPNDQALAVLANAIPITLSPPSLWSEESIPPSTQGTEPAALVVHQDVTTLKEAERLKDEFIAIAAHELRNPLAILKGNVHTLLFQHQQGRGPQLAEWQSEVLHDIDEATQQLTHLTEELLDVTRLQAGRLLLHPEPSNLIALSRRVVKRLQRTTQQHRLSLHTSQEPLVIPLDPGRMEQVLSNLIGNAIKYSPQGGPVEVTIRQAHQTAEVVLSVYDQGIGIPRQQQAHIFGRFFRATNARKIVGTGLGLYLCRSLVELHGGQLWFESVEGQGSTFFVALPSEGETVAPE